MLTVTVNPSLDIEVVVPVVEPERKLHCADPQSAPGGGGVNVARVAHRFGSTTLALFTSGGHTGAAVQRLLEQEGVPQESVPIAEPTRESLTVKETTTGRQFRFMLPGPQLSLAETDALLGAVAALSQTHAHVVISGSIPPRLGVGYLTRLIGAARQGGARVVVDTSGPPLTEAFDAGVLLVKPSLRELSTVVGRALDAPVEIVAAARELQERGGVTAVLVSLGEGGALLVERGAPAVHVLAPKVVVRSVVGAGDSLVAGVMVGLERGWSMAEAARLGVAAGTATVEHVGSRLCHQPDVEAILGSVTIEPVAAEAVRVE